MWCGSGIQLTRCGMGVAYGGGEVCPRCGCRNLCWLAETLYWLAETPIPIMTSGWLAETLCWLAETPIPIMLVFRRNL